MPISSKKLALLFFCAAVGLRLLLFWANPPSNAFDNHFDPIFRIIKTGTIPDKDACFQCYQPPVFYWLSAMTGKSAIGIGLRPAAAVKLMQFLNCLYGILTVAMIYLILQRCRLSDFARTFAFGTVCFLPRQIYMSAVNANDSLSYLAVAVCVYLLLRAVESRFSPGYLLGFGLAATLAIFTKYTVFVVLPMALAVFAAAWFRPAAFPRKRTLAAAALALLLPLAALGGSMVHNQNRYGSPLPWNLSLYDPSRDRPRDPGGISFVSFTPWEDVQTPLLAPGKLHSFWTLVYSGFWFDTEPLFQSYLDDNRDWWLSYYRWYRGEAAFPGPNPAVSRLTRVTAAGLITLGLVPLGLLLAGALRQLRDIWHPPVDADVGEPVSGPLFPVLLLANTAGIIALTLRLPVYCSMKASYFLVSLPALALFLGLGIAAADRGPAARRLLAILFGVLFTLASVHILQLSLRMLASPA